MGVDLYAGPLQRYYTRRWETPAQVHARAAGLAHEIHHASGVDPLSLSDDDAAKLVQAFQLDLAPKLELDLAQWREAFDVPYRSVQLTQEGLAALVLWAAHQHRPDLERPLELPDDVWETEAVQEASQRGYYVGPIATVEAHMIVPGAAPRITALRDPIGRDLVIVTTAALDDAIDALAPTLDIESGEVEKVIKEMPSLTGKALVRRKWWERHKSEWYEVSVQKPDDQVAAFARYGLACLMALHDFSQRHGVPILRDE
jgi:hypothetical protein